MKNPILPPLVIRIGFTGHRPNRLMVEPGRISLQVEQVLAAVDATAQDIVAVNPQLYLDVPPIKRFTCGMAPGADAIAAHVAAGRSWQLQAVLAFESTRFAALSYPDASPAQSAAYQAQVDGLLDQCASVLQIQGKDDAGLRRDAYELVGDVVLEQADVVLAVWDGLRAQGLGGTPNLVRHALARGLPVVWIHAAELVPPVVLLPGSSIPVSLSALGPWLHESLCLQATPLPASHRHGVVRDARCRWQEFCAERALSTNRFPPLFQLLLMLGGASMPGLGLRAADSDAAWQGNWSRFDDDLRAVDPVLAAAAARSLRAPFDRADRLAQRYGQVYRSAYVLIYLLAGVATGVGLLGLFFPTWKAVFVATELAAILLMIVIVTVGRRRQWHDRWLDYRAIAEQLRQARTGCWCGQSLASGNTDGDSNPAGASWSAWYVRACVRQLPMIAVTVDAAFLRKAIASIAELELRVQSRFNARTAKVHARVHERLETAEMILLSLLVAACSAFLLVYLFDPWGTKAMSGSWMGNAMSFVGALFPALGAVLLGIRFQGDFLAYAERTAETAAALQPVLDDAARWQQADAEPDFQTLLDLSRHAERALASDVFSWRMVYRRKALTVSA